MATSATVTWRCSVCANIYPSRDAFVDHVYAQHDSNDVVVQCPQCIVADGLYSDELITHLLLEHESTQSDSAPSTSTMDQPLKTASPHSVDDLYCPLCFAPYQDVDTLQVHIASVHDVDQGPSSTFAAGSSDLVLCPVCDMDGSHLSSGAFADHVNSHFGDKPMSNEDTALAAQLQAEENQHASQVEQAEFQALRQRYGMESDQGGYREQTLQRLEQQLDQGRITVGQMSNQKATLAVQEQAGREPNWYSVKGIIPIIRTLSQRSTDVADVILCSPQTEHFSTSRGDQGWGCGFRNMQMLLSAVYAVPQYRNALLGSDADSFTHIPSVPRLQELIERAWNTGFDRAGQAQLGGTLVGSRKWIGTTENAALLLSNYVRANIVDFHSATGSSAEPHPELFGWVWRYFHEQRRSQHIMPLYIQHEGHSRTVIGIERLKQKGQFRLLIFDPGHWKSRMTRFHAVGNRLTSVTPKDAADLMKPLRKRLQDMKHDQFQLIHIDGIVESQQEYNSYKQALPFERIP